MDEEFDRLEALFEVRVDPALRAATRTYIDLLLKWNRAINLIGRWDAAQLLERCFFESFWACAALPPDAVIADVGSGAGFPGLAMALFRPDLKVTLIEPNLKKTVFLKEVARRVGLSAAVHPDRAETHPGWKGTDFAVMRALKPSVDLLSILALEDVGLVLLHGREAAPAMGALRLLESRLQPGSRERRLSLFAARTGGRLDTVSRETRPP